LERKSFPDNVNSPIKVGARHLMKSSSTPPAVVTKTSTFEKKKSQKELKDLPFRSQRKKQTDKQTNKQTIFS
jgi:hypothetical protein